MQLLCASESIGLLERVGDGGTLSGMSRRFVTHSKARRATMVATPAMSATTWISDFKGSGSL